MKYFVYTFVTFAISLSVNGCAPRIHWDIKKDHVISHTWSKYVNENKKHILQSPTAITISPEEFLKLKSKYDGPKEYGGMGSLISVRGRGIGILNPVFNRILFDPADSTLLIEGTVYEYFSKEPYRESQIILGVLPDYDKNITSPKIDVLCNYIVPKGGVFSTVFNLTRRYQLIFAPCDYYNEEDGYPSYYVDTIDAYDVYKLIDLYSI